MTTPDPGVILVETSMHALRLLTGVAALTLTPAPSIVGQQSVPRPDDPPAFVVGDTVRVSLEPALGFRILPFQVGVRPVRVAGAVIANWAPDSLTLRRTALILYPWESRHHTVLWGEVEHLDVANGRMDAATGAAVGIVSAVIVGLSSGVFFCAFDSSGCGKWVLKGTAGAAIVTVPVGVIWGVLTPNWKRVY